MGGADVFPYPDDDPDAVADLCSSLTTFASDVSTAMTEMTAVGGDFGGHWKSPDGSRAVNEATQMSSLGNDVSSAIADAISPLTTYGNVLSSARSEIDGLRQSYDDEVTSYNSSHASLSSDMADQPQLRKVALAELQDSHQSTLSGLHQRYDGLITDVDDASRTASTELTGIAGRISPDPGSRNSDLIRLAVLDRLPFMAPTTGTTIIRTPSGIIVNSGDGDDTVRVTRDPATGQYTVTVNGVAYPISPEEAEDIVIRTNGGSDVVEVDPDIQLGFSISGGDGNDLIAGGQGQDVVYSGDGDDDVIGGKGNDTVAGGDGDDNLDEGLSFIGIPALAIKYGGRTVSTRDGGGNDRVSGGDGNDSVAAGDGNNTVSGGSGNDDIITGGGRDTIDAGDGSDTVDAGGGNDDITGGDGDDDIDAGGGDDAIDAGDGDDQVQAGEGNDNVDGGAGDDYIDGFEGADNIDAGDGDDTVYGGEGDDNVDGGAGDDYLDGYQGDDNITGGTGDDVLSGGSGDDSLGGGAGNDVTYAGKGDDSVYDHDGTNTVYAEEGDSVNLNSSSTKVTVEIASIPDNIKIEGSPEFQARVRADLETLANSPAGQRMLAEIGQEGDGGPFGIGGDELTIRETTDQNGYAIHSGDEYRIEYNPTFHLHPSGDDASRPINVLFHELAHSYDHMSDNSVDGYYIGPDADNVPGEIDDDNDGTITFDEADRDDDGDIDDDDLDLDGDGDIHNDGWTPNSERQAVGLPVDPDQDPSTGDVSSDDVVDHPDQMTENALRNEMGYDHRSRY